MSVASTQFGDSVFAAASWHDAAAAGLASGREPPSLTVVVLTRSASTMRITSKGQVTIPQEIREQLGLLPNTEVDFVVDGKTVRIVRVRGKRSRGKSVVDRLRGRANVPMTTDEILALTRKGA